MRGKRLKQTVAVLGGCLILYVGGTAWSIWTFPTEDGAQADAAIVLGASATRGRPSAVFAERINHGVALYRSGRVRELILTGGALDGEAVPLAVVAAQYAIERGVAPNAIVLESYSRITYENLKYTIQIAATNGLHSFLIVSDPLHMRRAMRMASDLRMNAKASATPTTCYTNLGSRLWFLKRETYYYLQHVFVTRFMAGRSLEDAIGEEKTLNQQVQPIAGKPGSG
jgi:uncharacterized SAM-binding protein YcdF (DUF218 family)